MKIILIRHTRTQHNISHFIKDDDDDFELSKEGIEEANCLRSKLKQELFKVDIVYCSKSARAKMTAELVFPDSELKLLPELKEINKGFKSFLNSNKLSKDITLDEWETTHNYGNDRDRLNYCYPSGMSLDSYIPRIIEVFKKIILKNSNKKTIAIVSHNGPLKAILTFVLGGGKETYLHMRVHHGAYSEIELIDKKFYLNFLNHY